MIYWPANRRMWIYIYESDHPKHSHSEKTHHLAVAPNTRPFQLPFSPHFITASHASSSFSTLLESLINFPPGVCIASFAGLTDSDEDREEGLCRTENIYVWFTRSSLHCGCWIYRSCLWACGVGCRMRNRNGELEPNWESGIVKASRCGLSRADV